LPGVVVALKLPQLPAGAHDHVTPALALSFVTVALKLAVVLICTVAESGRIATEIGGASIPTFVEADTFESVAKVAVIVTPPLLVLGTVLGAV
jgi:hypothetical protein